MRPGRRRPRRLISRASIAGNLTLVALDEDGEPVGFAVLMQNRAVSHVHVHPTSPATASAACSGGAGEARQGARGRGAGGRRHGQFQGFFAALGYQEKARNTVLHGEEWLGATTMELVLAAPKNATVQ